MKRLTLLLACFMLSMGLAIAQTTKVKGIVVDESNEPIAGVSVIVKGNTAIGTTTKVDGQFTLDVPASAKILIIKYLGMGDQEVAVGPDLRVVLKEEDSILGEVVVLGYGTGKKVGTIIGSVAKVTSAEIKERPTANVLDAIQGKVAGLQVYNSSGEPSSTPSLRLHGTGSLGASSTPLYVLDGMPISSSTFLSLNPNDFEIVSVLKDASATSIYGARGANGVVYISSKKGLANQDAIINVNAQYGVSNLANSEFYDKSMNSDELFRYWEETGFRTKEYIENYRKTYNGNTNWRDYYMKSDVPTYQLDLSLRGGGGKTTYFISGSYFNQDGIVYRSGYERYTLRSNIESRLNNWMKVGLNLSGGYDLRETSSNFYTGSNSTGGGLYFLVAPYYNPYKEDGSRYDIVPGTTRTNPAYFANNNPEDRNKIQFNGMAFAEFYPVKGLTLRTQVGTDAYDYTISTKTYPSYTPANGVGGAGEYFYRNATNTMTNTAEYRFQLKDTHNLTLLAGQEYVDNNYREFSGRSTGQTDDRLMLVSNGQTTKSADSASSEYAFFSLFGRADYNYGEKYFLDFNVRNDQSSRFGKDNRSAMFYSGGAMWDMKKESFLADVSPITAMKLRFSAGSSGNSEIDNYQHLATISTVAAYGGGTSWNVGTPGNSMLSWEKQFLGTLGVNTEFYGKYRLGVEVYKRSTKNMLMDVPTPYTTGYSTVTSNVGTMQNTGIDITIDLDLLKNKDWYVNFNTNFNYNKEKITELFNGLSEWTVPNTGVTYVVGKPVEAYWPLYAGIDPADGKQMWYVPGENISEMTKGETTKVFDPDGLLQTSGKPLSAPIAGGFGATASYKGISVLCNFAYAYDKWLYDNDRFYSENPAIYIAQGMNQSRRVFDYWKKAGDVTLFPKLGEQLQFDSHLLEDASFLRLKTLTLAYQVPTSLLKKTHFFKGVRVYGTARNLLTFTNYLGIDPEIDTNLTRGAYPNTKQFVFGIDITL